MTNFTLFTFDQHLGLQVSWFQVDSKGEGSFLPSDLLEAHLMKYLIIGPLEYSFRFIILGTRLLAGCLQGHQTNKQIIFNLAPGTVPSKAPSLQSVGSSRGLEDAKVGELDTGEVPAASSELHPPHLFG